MKRKTISIQKTSVAFRTFDTVWRDTPATPATSLTVGCVPIATPSSGGWI
jgi:hypothetical protein